MRWVCPSEKTQFFWPPPKLIFCHEISPLDWIMVIWAIFGLPGPFGGSGGPMWGLGGLAKTKFSNFHMRPFLALRCHFLDLTSFKHYDFGFLGQNWGLVAEKRPIFAKIGYMQKWIFLKNISSNFVYIAPKWLSSTIINDDICLFLHPNYKNFHYERFCDFCQKLTLTGWNWRGPPTTSGRGQSDHKTLPTGKIHNYKSFWPTLGPFWYNWGAQNGPFGLKQTLTGRKAPERPMTPGRDQSDPKTLPTCEILNYIKV